MDLTESSEVLRRSPEGLYVPLPEQLEGDSTWVVPLPLRPGRPVLFKGVLILNPSNERCPAPCLPLAAASVSCLPASGQAPRVALELKNDLVMILSPRGRHHHLTMLLKQSREWRLRVLSLGLLFLTSVACTDLVHTPKPVEPPQRTPTISLEQAITGDAVASLREGLFQVGVPPDEPEVEITAERAVDLAVALVRQFGQSNRTTYEAAVGRSLRFNDMRADARVFFVRSPYGPIDHKYAKPSRKFLGGHYIVNLRQDGIIVLSVSVSALAGDLSIQDGRIVFPSFYGNEFVIVPVRPRWEYPIGPERAVRLASELAGPRVKEAPVLVRHGVTNLWAPQYGLWRVVFERPARTTGGSLVDTAYVSWEGDVLTRSASTEPDRFLLTLADRSGSELVVLPSRPGIATRLTHTSFSR
jgi:hypothetical protein